MESDQGLSRRQSSYVKVISLPAVPTNYVGDLCCVFLVKLYLGQTYNQEDIGVFAPL